MRTLVFAVFVLVFTALPASAGGLQLSIRDGRVTLDAQDVTVRQILTEWARIGKTRIINVERITGGPVTLKLEGIPEKQALDIVLRTVPGYMAVPRETFVADASIYDRILVMPTTTAVAAARPQPAPGFPGMQPGANVTQLRPPPPVLTPGALPENDDPEPGDDPAIAAAVAAGLVPVPAPAPAQTAISGPLVLPGSAQTPPAQTPAATGPTPSNPWNTPASSSVPTFTPPPPPPAPATTGPITRPRPPQQPDR
jgi:hypothetical protein